MNSGRNVNKNSRKLLVSGVILTYYPILYADNFKPLRTRHSLASIVAKDRQSSVLVQLLNIGDRGCVFYR